MILIQVGNEPERTKAQQSAFGAKVASLVADETFQSVLVEAADECVREWAKSKTPEQREAAWIRLQGLRALEVQLQKAIDRGTSAAQS